MCEQLEAMVFTEEYRESELDVVAEYFPPVLHGRHADGSPGKRTRVD